MTSQNNKDSHNDYNSNVMHLSQTFNRKWLITGSRFYVLYLGTELPLLSMALWLASCLALRRPHNIVNCLRIEYLGLEHFWPPESALACRGWGTLQSEFNCDMSLCMEANVQRIGMIYMSQRRGATGGSLGFNKYLDRWFISLHTSSTEIMMHIPSEDIRPQQTLRYTVAFVSQQYL